MYPRGCLLPGVFTIPGSSSGSLGVKSFFGRTASFSGVREGLPPYQHRLTAAPPPQTAFFDMDAQRPCLSYVLQAENQEGWLGWEDRTGWWWWWYEFRGVVAKRGKKTDQGVKVDTGGATQRTGETFIVHQRLLFKYLHMIFFFFWVVSTDDTSGLSAPMNGKNQENKRRHVHEREP